MDKSTRWAFTAYETQWGLLKQIPNEVAEWGWQEEVCPKTGKVHRQGYLRTRQQMRRATLSKIFPGIHLEVAKHWQELIDYCSKPETSVAGTQHYEENMQYTVYTYAEHIAQRIVQLERSDDWTRESVDSWVRLDVELGVPGVEWIASNPQWATMWNKFWQQKLKAKAKTYSCLVG